MGLIRQWCDAATVRILRLTTHTTRPDRHNFKAGCSITKLMRVSLTAASMRIRAESFKVNSDANSSSPAHLANLIVLSISILQLGRKGRGSQGAGDHLNLLKTIINERIVAFVWLFGITFYDFMSEHTEHTMYCFFSSYH